MDMKSNWREAIPPRIAKLSVDQRGYPVPYGTATRSARTPLRRLASFSATMANWLEACRRAGIEPQIVTLNGQDPVLFILSSNVNRRHLNQGHKAMATARACLLSKQSQREGSNGVLASAIEWLSAGHSVFRSPINESKEGCCAGRQRGRGNRYSPIKKPRASVRR